MKIFFAAVIFVLPVFVFARDNENCDEKTKCPNLSQKSHQAQFVIPQIIMSEDRHVKIKVTNENQIFIVEPVVPETISNCQKTKDSVKEKSHDKSKRFQRSSTKNSQSLDTH